MENIRLTDHTEKYIYQPHKGSLYFYQPQNE